MTFEELRGIQDMAGESANMSHPHTVEWYQGRMIQLLCELIVEVHTLGVRLDEIETSLRGKWIEVLSSQEGK